MAHDNQIAHAFRSLFFSLASELSYSLHIACHFALVISLYSLFKRCRLPPVFNMMSWGGGGGNPRLHVLLIFRVRKACCCTPNHMYNLCHHFPMPIGSLYGSWMYLVMWKPCKPIPELISWTSGTRLKPFDIAFQKSPFIHSVSRTVHLCIQLKNRNHYCTRECLGIFNIFSNFNNENISRFSK